MTLNSKTNQVRNEVSNTIFSSVRSIVARRTTPWVGTMTELGETIENRVSVPKNWPGSASALRVAFNRVINRLRNAGVSVRFTRSTNHMRTRLVVLTVR
jgi:hypothetical protein